MKSLEVATSFYVGKAGGRKAKKKEVARVVIYLLPPKPQRGRLIKVKSIESHDQTD